MSGAAAGGRFIGGASWPGVTTAAAAILAVEAGTPVAGMPEATAAECLRQQCGRYFNREEANAPTPPRPKAKTTRHGASKNQLRLVPITNRTATAMMKAIAFPMSERYLARR